MKKLILVLSVVSLILTSFTSCLETNGTDTDSDGTSTATTTTSTKTNSTTTTTTKPTSKPDDSGDKDKDESVNVTDFKYVENGAGGITITKYIGTDTDVVIPEKIEEKK